MVSGVRTSAFYLTAAVAQAARVVIYFVITHTASRFSAAWKMVFAMAAAVPTIPNSPVLLMLSVVTCRSSSERISSRYRRCLLGRRGVLGQIMTHESPRAMLQHALPVHCLAVTPDDAARDLICRGPGG